jgi:hypothetical protein
MCCVTSGSETERPIKLRPARVMGDLFLPYVKLGSFRFRESRARSRSPRSICIDRIQRTNSFR